MAARKPLVMIAGRPSILPSGDTLEGAGGSAVVHERTVDFTVSRKSGVFSVTVPGVLTSQRIVASVSGQMPAGVSFDELEMDPLTVTGFVSAADTVTLLVASLGGPVKGQRNISMMIG